MKALEKYLEFLKREYSKKTEQKINVDKLVKCAKDLIDALNSNINTVKEDSLKKIFDRIDTVDTEKKLLEFKNIKRISIFFNDKRFEKQPQVIAAKKSLEETKKLLENYLMALELMISRDGLDNLEVYQYQIDIINRINKHEKLSSEELSYFYKILMNYLKNDEEVNEIVMQIFNYMSDVLNKEINMVNVKVTEEKKSENNSEKSEVADNIKLTDEEKDLIIKYRDKINAILKLANDKYDLVILGINDLRNCIEGENLLPEKFITEVKDVFGIELTFENVKLLDDLNDILILVRDSDIDNMAKELREILNKLDNVFQIVENEENLDDDKEFLKNILNNPQALVIYLDDENNQGRVSYVEEDYDLETKNGDRRKANTAVKKIITQFYAGTVNSRADGDVKKFFGDLNLLVLHAIPERDMRCFYAKMPISNEVRKYLCDTYNISIDDIKNFRVYLYVGFLHIGNHRTDYADEQYNRCNLSTNISQVKRLLGLFSKEKLDISDMTEIDQVINKAFDITKKLNNIERKKRYE